ncbi:MAG: hypothetical protein JWQ94_2741 [Tardiphaga sp.]|jgi:PIN domain nuclease of toxin-antitoxin system|nr:hypothetical protein [Tardiphaga sp.]
MHNAATMNSDVKALLTLLLLKTGTSSQEIHNSLQLAAASRVMMAEEFASPVRAQACDATTNNVAKLRPIGGNPDILTAAARRLKQTADAMNSDIKALLTLLLLKNGAGSSEIQTALRMAAASRAALAEEQADAVRAETHAETVSAEAVKAVRNELIGPVPAKEFAA